MTLILFKLMAWITRAHDYILTFNDRFEVNLSDKQMHFLVIGTIGLGLILIIYPLFKWLSSKKRVLAITWIYVLTVLVVLTFAIEIGQGITGTGSMEFGDIVAGMQGFFALTAVIIALRTVIWAIRTIVGLFRREPERGCQRAKA